MADNDALILGEIQDKYVPFLKRLIAFLEKNQKVTPDNLNRLKSIYTVFTTSSISEQIDTFKANKKKLEKWYKNPKKDKLGDDTPSAHGSKRSLVIEDTDSSQGASDTAPSKRSRSSPQDPAVFDPSLAAQIKKEKADRPSPVAVVQPVQPVAPADEPLVFTCASCQYQSPDEQEFMKHTRTDHRSDLSMWCKLCGKCFSNAGVLVSHIKERACAKEEMIYRCGVKECTFETTSGQTFVHHLRHCHKGSPFIFCVHCQKIFTLPHCLILHMQDDCPYKDKNRRNPGSTPAPTQPSPAQPAKRPPVASFTSHTPTIASVTSGVGIRPVTPVSAPIRGGLTPKVRGRGGGLVPSSARGRGRGRGRGRLAVEESSDSDDPDDPSWKPEELPGQSMLRRSGRFAKKVNDVVNVLPKSTSKGLTSEELKNAKEMVPCPCCDYLAAFKSVLQDHYIAQHKVPNKNACLVCHLKFESSQGFIEHFEDHANGKLPNGTSQKDPITVQEDSNSRMEVTEVQPVEKVADVSQATLNVQPAGKVILDEELLKGVVKNISEANVIDPTSDKEQFIKIPYQAAIHDKGSKDAKLKKFEELKSPNDLMTMRSTDKLKCFYKCVMYGCTFTSDNSDEFSKHCNTMHNGKKLNCNYCLKEFFSGEVLVQHMMAEHSKRQFQCSNCFYRACSIKHIKTHIHHYHPQDAGTVILECDPIKVAADVTVSGEPTENTTWPYICAIGECVYQSFDPKDFGIHNDTVHRTVSVFFCHYCKVDFISFKRLLNHYRLHGINALQCNYCIHGSETKEDILLHLCNAHADYPMKAFKRGLSEENAPSTPSNFPLIQPIETVKVTSSPRPESPPVEVVEGNQTDFEELLYEVVGETYYPKYLRGMATDFVCGVPFCHEKFEGMLTYIGHLSNCHAAVNFPCPNCPHVSEEWVDFKNHLMCHGPELFACGLVTCSFYDWNKNVVTEHLKSHSQSKAKVVIVREESDDDNDIEAIKSLPQSYSATISGASYQCLFCRYKSGKKNIMKNHLYSEVMYKRFSCSSCDEKHVSRKDIKEHYIERHSDQDIKCSVHPNPSIENAVQRLLDLNVVIDENKADQCGNCKKNFKTVIHLQKHVYLCTRKQYQPFECNYCKSSFQDVKILKFHLDEKHFRRPSSFSVISSQLVEDILALKFQQVRLEHLKQALSSVSPPSDTLPICFVKFYICNSCSYESNHKHNTQLHIENEHKDTAVEITKMLRNIDMPDLTKSQFTDTTPKDQPPQTATVSAGKTKPYRCGFCIKRLHSLPELEKHVESMHSVLDEDEYAFYYSPEHQALLTDDLKYECSYCKSGKDTLAALKKHSDLMHPESAFRVRGFVRRDQLEMVACGYCFQRVRGTSELKQHTEASHPGFTQKSLGGFQKKGGNKRPAEEEGLPNKRVRFPASVFVCDHCGAAYATQGQVTGHSKKAHTRLQARFTEEQEGDRMFYKCEFCQFTSEQNFLDLHLKTKHKNRVTCGHCTRRFEFASKLKEHHDLAHKGLPVKYSQETLPFIKKEPLDPEEKTGSTPSKNSKSPSKNSRTSPKNSKASLKRMSGLNGVYVSTDGLSGDPPSKLALSTFALMYDIYPEVILKRCDEGED